MIPHDSAGRPGDADVTAAVDDLAARLPDPLRPLGRVAYNAAWSWHRAGPGVFASIDAHRFATSGHNPVRFLRDLSGRILDRAAADPDLVASVARLAGDLDAYCGGRAGGRPVAFFCAEYGVHPSLPIYSGGLGVLAGDILKEASDRGLPFVGVGLLYRRGYFRQRLDPSGRQHEYWVEVDPESLPAVLVSKPGDGGPLQVSVPIRGEQVVANVWRTDVGRVPLYLLDAGIPANSPLAQWITARLYEGNHAVRLAQYAMLGVGGMRALRAMGIDPQLVHLNEGHAALSVLDLANAERREGESVDDALARVRERVVFTTHTPVAAGNETYDAGEILDVYSELREELRVDPDHFLGFGRIDAGDPSERAGMTPLAIRASRSTNAVSARHGEVSRHMWAGFDTEFLHVTNGVHVPTWMAPAMRDLLDRYLPDGWERTADDPATWAAVDSIPDEELWAVRSQLRATLIAAVRARSVTDRLARGEDLAYVGAAEAAFDPERLTVGFARRLATYKRLHLLTLDAGRAVALLRELQFVFAGKAHPADEEAKRVAQVLFALKGAAAGSGNVAFVEDYDLRVAPLLVSGCDVWLNVPRPPLEASGTSGMKAAMNGGLNLSVLDGWWAEAYDGTNGWAINGDVDADEAAQDARDAAALYDRLEHDVIATFQDRDASGIPRRWVGMIKASLRTIGPRFSATRMLADYERDVYRLEGR